MRLYRGQWILAMAIAGILLTGCGKNTEIVTDNKEYKGYSLPEIMIVAATEKNRYEKVYTDQIWQVKLGEEDVLFEDYLCEQVESFMDELKIMNLLATEKEITLSSSEKDQIRKLSEEYFSGLTKEDVNYMKISRDDVVFLYEEYHLANKLVNELTKDVNLEVSDNEAKVITIQQIRFEDKETADRAYDEMTWQDVPFDTVVKNYSPDKVTKLQVGRGELPPAIEEAAFSLESEQVSPVTESEGGYYILKALSAYDEAATMERKKRLSAERKNQAFRQIYDQFLSQNPVDFQHDVWNRVSFSEADDSTTTNFFELYKEYFPG